MIHFVLFVFFPVFQKVGAGKVTKGGIYRGTYLYWTYIKKIWISGKGTTRRGGGGLKCVPISKKGES